MTNVSIDFNTIMKIYKIINENIQEMEILVLKDKDNMNINKYDFMCKKIRDYKKLLNILKKNIFKDKNKMNISILNDFINKNTYENIFN